MGSRHCQWPVTDDDRCHQPVYDELDDGRLVCKYHDREAALLQERDALLAFKRAVLSVALTHDHVRITWRDDGTALMEWIGDEPEEPPRGQ